MINIFFDVAYKLHVDSVTFGSIRRKGRTFNEDKGKKIKL